ncbi:IS66 family insertion sequence element accessory protein TnpB [Variovorax sp. J31P207]|uniref:IS66 family insertion sequence element accessory protein TnpB n=1 Tax=Variovorax sp. J31P207 TaxID=3053510 RepID=UPI0033654841
MDTLAAKVQTALTEDPYSGHVFVFRGRRGDLVKLLWSDGDGMCLSCATFVPSSLARLAARCRARSPAPPRRPGQSRAGRDHRLRSHNRCAACAPRCAAAGGPAVPARQCAVAPCASCEPARGT